MSLSDIIFLTQPEAVSMGDAWFSIASLDHFWIRRRLEVLRQIVKDERFGKVAEIGCGNGLIQRQFEEVFDVEVDGFDLNVPALEGSFAQRSRRFCYNIHQKDESLRAQYDTVILFDVLEHLSDDKTFLESACYHLRAGGRVIINVPALPELFSAYDKAAGHVRRYLAEDLILLCQSVGLNVEAWSYWGRPMLPLLKLRKRRLERVSDGDEVLRDGFSSRNGLVNSALHLLSRCETLPNQQRGTSLMLIARAPGQD